MDAATMSTIIISVFGAMIVGLFVIIWFFLTKVLDRSDGNEKLLIALDKNVGIMQKDMSEVIRQLQGEIARMHKVQELLRARVHYVINKLTAIKVKLETQKGLGIQFANEDWKLPDAPHEMIDP